MNDAKPEAPPILVARNASISDLLKTGAVRGQLVRRTLLLSDGNAKTIELKGLLKSQGCTWDAANKVWKRACPTVQEVYAMGVATAREATLAAEAKNKEEARIDAMLASGNTIDMVRRAGCWVGMPLAPLTAITPEARAAAWARHGTDLPAMHGPHRDVYGNIICA